LRHLWIKEETEFALAGEWMKPILIWLVKGGIFRAVNIRTIIINWIIYIRAYPSKYYP
tara:strand:- start:183 stop:356 length:174 start_codon:yes stop_codon:yes gene_type:complete